MQIKHNGQTKVCNLCFGCGLIGHLRHDCPDEEEAPDDSISSDELSGGESSVALFSDQASLASSSELVIDEAKDDEPAAPDHSTCTSRPQPPNVEPVIISQDPHPTTRLSTSATKR